MIRPAVLGDAAALATVHVLTWQHTYRGVVPQEYLDGLTVERRAEQWSAMLSDSSERLNVLVNTNARGFVDGFVSYGPSRDEDCGPDVWEIYAIYVLPIGQRVGTGTALLDQAIRHVPDSVNRVTLWVLEANQSARDFYETAGFTSDGTSQQLSIGDAPVTELRYTLTTSE